MLSRYRNVGEGGHNSDIGVTALEFGRDRCSVSRVASLFNFFGRGHGLGLRPVCLSTGTPAPFPGTAQYRHKSGTDPKFPRDFEGRVPGTPYTVGFRESIHDTPKPAEYMHHHAPLSTLLCTPHAAEQTQGAEGGPGCHPSWGNRRWCSRRLLISYVAWSI